MASTRRGPRPRGRRGMSPGGGPSVREVCLLGADGVPAPTWAPGAWVRWAGRAYRVTATQAEAAGGARYVYLSPAADP